MLEPSLINCKVELKLRRTKHYALSVLGVDNGYGDGAKSTDIIFIIKFKKLYVLVVTLSEKTTKNYRIFLAKDLKGQCIRTNIYIKKSENKNTTNEY